MSENYRYLHVNEKPLPLSCWGFERESVARENTQESRDGERDIDAHAGMDRHTHTPGGEATMRMAMSACDVPVIMFLMKSRCPGASIMVNENFSVCSAHQQAFDHVSAHRLRARVGN